MDEEASAVREFRRPAAEFWAASSAAFSSASCYFLSSAAASASSSATDYLLETAVVYDALAIIKQIPSQRRKLHHDSEKGVAHAAMPGEEDA